MAVSCFEAENPVVSQSIRLNIYLSSSKLIPNAYRISKELLVFSLLWKPHRKMNSNPS